MARPRYLHEIPTPALVIELAAMDRNLRRMAEFFADGPCRVRPRFQAHTTPEAEVAAAFCDDILIANQVIGRDKCARVAGLAKSIDIKIAVDSNEGLDQIA